MRFTLSPRALNSDLYNENKYVFKFFLNDSMEIDDRSSYGKLFHVFGPQKSKLASPFFESTLGIFKYNVSLLEDYSLNDEAWITMRLNILVQFYAYIYKQLMQPCKKFFSLPATNVTP